MSAVEEKTKTPSDELRSFWFSQHTHVVDLYMPDELREVRIKFDLPPLDAALLDQGAGPRP